MIWILLAALGILLSMIVGLLVGAGLSRRAFMVGPFLGTAARTSPSD